MLTYTIRRLILSVPVLLFIALIIFLLLQLAPGDPMAQVPLTVPPEVKQKMREALGLGAEIERRLLHHDPKSGLIRHRPVPPQPPVIGGKNATSLAPASGASSPRTF